MLGAVQTKAVIVSKVLFTFFMQTSPFSLSPYTNGSLNGAMRFSQGCRTILAPLGAQMPT